MARLFSPALAAVLAALCACAQPEDIPSNVHDLRVLAVQLEPPELMAPSCPDPQQPLDPSVLLPFLQPVQLRALVLDPAGDGRGIAWKLWACPKQSTRVCTPDEDGVLLLEGTDPAGEWTMTVENLAARVTRDGTPLVQRVVENDTFRGLGGIRVPLFLNAKVGEEEIWAQKLMVLSCRLFPEMAANVNPELPDLLLGGEVWSPDLAAPPTLAGAGPFEVEPADFKDRQEDYTVVSFELQPVALTEAWKIAWHADFGRFSPNTTGGADFGGGEPRHRVEWVPPRQGEGREVRFWVVVRDGRGGMSWTERRGLFER